MVEDLVKGGRMPTDLGGGPHINVSALEPYLEQLKPFCRHIIVLGHDLIVNGSFQVADIHKIELNGSERHTADAQKNTASV